VIDDADQRLENGSGCSLPRARTIAGRRRCRRQRSAENSESVTTVESPGRTASVGRPLPSDGGPAIVRARGKLHPLPFFESLVGVVYHDGYEDIDAAIDYELAPGSEHVDVRYRYSAPRRPRCRACCTH